jgi:uncharacterized protein (TIGR02246 family)
VAEVAKLTRALEPHSPRATRDDDHLQLISHDVSLSVHNSPTIARMTPEDDRAMRQDVSELLVRYASGLDRKDWALLRTCFTDDCEADYGDVGAWHDADSLTAWMERVHAPLGHSLHRITNQVVTSDGDGVVARSYVDVILMGLDARLVAHGTGYYDDELARTADGWKIARRKFTMVSADPTATGDAAPLAEIEAIKQLKARYFRTMDAKDWAAMRDVFSDDVVMDTTSSGGGVVAGADEFLVFLEGAIGDVVTVHHGHMPEIELTSPTTATGVWAMEDMLRWPDGSEMHGYGHYHETYVKVGGTWRIATSTLTRLRTDFAGPPEG